MSVGYINQRRATEAALNNEQVTRERVAKLEAQIRSLSQYGAALDVVLREFKDRDFWGRLRWLFTGR
jgi:hypothetical protein